MNTPKFKVGDRVRIKTGDLAGVVTVVRFVYHTPSGVVYGAYIAARFFDFEEENLELVKEAE